MLDWITAMIPCKINTLVTDKVIKFRPNGEIVYEMDCSTFAESSFFDKVTVRCITRPPVLNTEKANCINKIKDIKESIDYPYCLRIDGNPSKWFQGHNVDGVFDLGLMRG
jgi:II/X family phage/plasmid replication protein